MGHFAYPYVVNLMKLYALTLWLLLIVGMSGCGQPGPLYLPDKPSPVHVDPEAKKQSSINQ